MAFLPRHFGITPETVVSSESLLDWVHDKSMMSELIQQHLARAQERMHTQANKSHSERQFSVGNWVYLKLQPYVQESLAPRSNQKLVFKFFGPFQVLEKIGPVAYKLELLATSSIHPAFHVSQLKMAVPASHSIASLPQVLDGLQIPLKVL